MRSPYLLVLMLLGHFLISGCSGGNTENKLPGELPQSPDEITVLSQKIMEDSLNPGLYHERARLYLDKNMINPALKDLGKSIELDPDRSEFYITLADAYLAMGKLPNCIESLQKAEKLNPASNDAMLKLAEVYLILQDYENTYNYVKKALTLDTKNPRAYFIRGYALMEMGDTLAAIRNIQNALDQNQQYYEAAVQLGILYASKRNPLAEQYFRAAMDIDPNREAAYYLLGMFYQDTEKMAEAIDTYDKLIVIDPNFKEAYYNMGYINLVYYQDFQRAIELFTQAIQVDPQYLDAWFNRGYSAELSGDYKSARKDYQKALEITPNYDRAVEGLNRLDQLGQNH